jgi:hypothetical protein
MLSNEPQRRRAERVELAVPLGARLGGSHVVLSDISIVGAAIEHASQIPKDSIVPLVFRWERQEIELDARVIRSRLESRLKAGFKYTVYRTGLAFETESNPLRSAMARRIAKAMSRQLADAYADASRAVTDSSGAINLKQLLPIIEQAKKKPLYRRCSLVRGTWRSEIVMDPAQPELGFTISADESEREVDLLCRTYMAAPVEQRQLIRIFAHLSIAEASDTPRNTFRP